MKRNKKEKLKEVARIIAELEKECQMGKNVQENMSKMDELVTQFDITDLLLLDEFILENNLLTK